MYQDFSDKNQVFQGMFCRFSDARYESMRDEIPYELYRPYRQMDFSRA